MDEDAAFRSSPDSPELIRVARRLVWWQKPEQTLADRIRFLAQVMNIGTWNDISTVARECGESVFNDVLDNPPPGVFTARRWNFWHVRLRRDVVPTLPTRFPA